MVTTLSFSSDPLTAPLSPRRSAPRPHARTGSARCGVLPADTGAATQAPPAQQYPGRSTGPAVPGPAVPAAAVPDPEQQYPPAQQYRPDQYSAAPAQQYSPPPVPQYSAPEAQQYSAPPVPQYPAPAAQQYSAPPAQQYSAPLAQQYSAPPAQQYSAPPAQQYSAPPAQQYSAPPAQRYSAPPAQQYSAPPAQQHSAPPSQHSQPAANGTGPEQSPTWDVPSLRLVTPHPHGDPSDRDLPGPPALRVIDGGGEGRSGERSKPSDDDLLIFSRTIQLGLVHPWPTSVSVPEEPPNWGQPGRRRLARGGAAVPTRRSAPRPRPACPAACRRRTWCPARPSRRRGSCASCVTPAEHRRAHRRATSAAGGAGQEIGGFAVGQRDRAAWEFNREQRARQRRGRLS